MSQSCCRSHCRNRGIGDADQRNAGLLPLPEVPLDTAHVVLSVLMLLTGFAPRAAVNEAARLAVFWSAGGVALFHALMLLIGALVRSRGSEAIALLQWQSRRLMPSGAAGRIALRRC